MYEAQILYLCEIPVFICWSYGIVLMLLLGTCCHVIETIST